MYDELEAETSTFADATRILFTLQTSRRISGASFSAIVETVYDSAATIIFKYPGNNDPDAVLSSAPLGGSFTITC